jgi:hypothetical protein
MSKSNFEKQKYEQQLGLEPKPKLNSSAQVVPNLMLGEEW